MNLDVYLLLPLISLSTVILTLMMLIAFCRNLSLTCAFSSIGLTVTLLLICAMAIDIQDAQTASLVDALVTPLIIVDAFALFFSGLMVFSSLCICLLSFNYHCARGEHQDEFYLLLLLATLGGVVLSQAAHFAMFILGLELLGVPIYAMISYPRAGRFSLEAALKYLILSGVSSAIILFGIALLYAAFGTLSFAEMAVLQRENSELDALYILAGSAMLLSGLAFKLSLAPFHMWTPDVYEGAPAPVTTLLATVSKGAIFAVLFRFFLSVDNYQYETILDGLFLLAVASIIFGNLLALTQSSIKRMLAYSSIAHLGYLLVAFIAADSVGGRALAIEASAIFLLAYFLTTIGAFGVVTVMSTEASDHDVDRLNEYGGLFWRRPMLATVFSVMLLSLAGIPLTAGFIGKFYIVVSGVDAELWSLLVIVVIGSGIGIFYYLRTIFAMTKRTTVTSAVHVPLTAGWTLAAVTLLLLVFGIYPTPVIEWVSRMAQAMT